jgi:hypothetical protein
MKKKITIFYLLCLAAVMLAGCRQHAVNDKSNNEKSATDELNGIWFDTSNYAVVKIDMENSKYYVTTNPKFHELSEDAFAYGHDMNLDRDKKRFTLTLGDSTTIYSYKLSDDGNVLMVKQKWSTSRFVKLGSKEAKEYVKTEADLEEADIA